MKSALIPFVGFIVLAGFLAVGLRLDPREVPSPLIGRPVPSFTSSTLHDPARAIAPKDLRGRVWVLNVWASWCVACRHEHSTLVEWARGDQVALYGLNYKDKREDAMGWLRDLGNPYTESLHDPQGLIGLDLGVYGVPETFVIDRDGIVRLKHVGAVTEFVLRDKILPLLRRLDAKA